MKSKSNAKPTIEDICEECGCPYAETHEIFGGNPGRHYSQVYGLQAKLCYIHHRNSPTGIHFNEEMQKKYKRWAKEKFINDEFPARILHSCISGTNGGTCSRSRVASK